MMPNYVQIRKIPEIPKLKPLEIKSKQLLGILGEHPVLVPVSKRPPPRKKRKAKKIGRIVKQFTFFTKWPKFCQSEARQLILPYTAVTASGLCNSARVTELTYQ